MAGVWAVAQAAARSPTQASMPVLRKHFLHRAEAAIACTIDVIVSAARRGVVDRLGPVDSQRRVNRGGDVLRIDRPVTAPSRVSDRGAGCIARADHPSAAYAATPHRAPNDRAVSIPAPCRT